MQSILNKQSQVLLKILEPPFNSSFTNQSQESENENVKIDILKPQTNTMNEVKIKQPGCYKIPGPVQNNLTYEVTRGY